MSTKLKLSFFCFPFSLLFFLLLVLLQNPIWGWIGGICLTFSFYLLYSCNEYTLKRINKQIENLETIRARTFGEPAKHYHISFVKESLERLEQKVSDLKEKKERLQNLLEQYHPGSGTKKYYRKDESDKNLGKFHRLIREYETADTKLSSGKYLYTTMEEYEVWY